MATYKEIQEHVRKHNGFVPKTCWIAHVLSDHDLTKRTAPNRVKKDSRQYPCPIEKRPAIEAALKHLKVL